MDKEAYLATYDNNTRLLADAARLGLDAPVPSCPGWLVSSLVGHISGVQRFWYTIVTTHATEPVRPPAAAFESVPGLLPWIEALMEGKADPGKPPAGLVEWYQEGAAQLGEALRNADPDEPAWHWSGDNRVWASVRMQAVEAAVHRWDAENAHSRAQPIQTDLARDGIDHYFDVMMPLVRQGGQHRKGEGETFHFHRTDGEGEWLLRFDGDDVSVSREHVKADVAVRGSASDLFLYLWGRVPASSLDVVGDAALLDQLRELIPPA